MKQIFVKNILPLVFVLVIAIPICLPFFRKGFFVSHDGEWAIIRLTAFHFSLKDGQLPPRWAASLFHTYGYPVLNFNYPLPPVIGEAFHLLGLNFVDSVKAVFIVSIVFSGIGMYLFAREIFGVFPAILSTILYLYYPFRFVDLFVRGSIGESLIFSIIPFSYLAVMKLARKKNWLWISGSAVTIALIILAHNSIALISLPFLFLFMGYVYYIKGRKNLLLKLFLESIILGILLSAFFWLPAMYEKRWTILQPDIITKPTNHFPDIFQLIFPSWGYGRSKTIDSLSFQIGPFHLILFVISLVYIYKKKIKLAVFFIFSLLATVFFILPISSFFWKTIPLMVYISYPWRLLVPLGFYVSLLGGMVLKNSKNKIINIGLISVALIIIYIITNNYRRPLGYIDKPDMYYITNFSTTIEGDENTPLWVKIPPKNAPDKKVIANGDILIISQKSNLLEFELDSPSDQTVTVNTIYYPGWRLLINAKETRIEYNNQMGLITFPVTAGKSRIKLFFGETPLRLAADLTSLGTFAYLIIRITAEKKNENTS